MTGGRKPGGDVDGGGGLAHAAFLVGDGYHLGVQRLRTCIVSR